MLATIEARLGSTRLPCKVLFPFGPHTIIEEVYNRALEVDCVTRALVITTASAKDDLLCDFLTSKSIEFFRGSELNVWDRLIQATKGNINESFIKLTGDNPLIDPQLISDAEKQYRASDNKILAISEPRVLPIGLDFEIVDINCLFRLYKESISAYHKEHGTTYMKEVLPVQQFKMSTPICKDLIKKYEFTLDTLEDYRFLTYISGTLLKDIKSSSIYTLLDQLEGCKLFSRGHVEARKWSKGY